MSPATFRLNEAQVLTHNNAGGLNAFLVAEGVK